MSIEHILRDEAELLALSLGEEFGMEHQDFYEGLFLTMERSGQDFRSEQEKLEQELIDWMMTIMTIDLWNVYTNKIGQASLTVSCYDKQSQHIFFF